MMEVACFTLGIRGLKIFLLQLTLSFGMYSKLNSTWITTAMNLKKHTKLESSEINHPSTGGMNKMDCGNCEMSLQTRFQVMVEEPQ